MLFRLQCQRTLTRRGVAYPLPADSSHVKFSLEIPKAEVRESVEVFPLLCRTRDGEEVGYATRKGARIADGRPWHVRIDKKPGPPGRYLDIRWDSFSANSNLPDGKAFYHLEVGEHPKLWLNSDFEELREILNAQGTVGPNARQRDALFDRISHAVWTQLFIHALKSAGATGEAAFEWQDATLHKLVPRLESSDDIATATANLHERFDQDPSAVVHELDRLLQLDHPESHHWRELIRESQKGS